MIDCNKLLDWIEGNYNMLLFIDVNEAFIMYQRRDIYADREDFETIFDIYFG